MYLLLSQNTFLVSSLLFLLLFSLWNLEEGSACLCQGFNTNSRSQLVHSLFIHRLKQSSHILVIQQLSYKSYNNHLTSVTVIDLST